MNKVLIALLSGVAIGILIAPEKGSDTRKKLSKGLNDLTDDFNKLVDREKRMLNNAVRTITEVEEEALV